MANITITIPDAVIARVIAALKDYGDAPRNQGSMTDSQFARKVIVDFAKSVTVAYEVKVAESTARINAKAEAEEDITIT